MISFQIPTELREFLVEIESLGFSLCLVGGIVRDHFMKKNESTDYDIEIRASDIIEDQDWPLYYQKLIDYLKSKNLNIELLPYMITRVHYLSYSLEFSSPRVEKFNSQQLSHHNFNSVASSNLSFAESFNRRDFTINAIGIKLLLSCNQQEIIDPFNGLLDINNKILRNISDDFFNDPVRLLRLIRFENKFKFEISPAIKENFSKFNLSELSEFHFKTEMFKTGNIRFLTNFKKIILENKILLNTKYNWILKIDENIISEAVQVKNREDLLVAVMLYQDQLSGPCAEFLQQPKYFLPDIKSLYLSVKALNTFTKEDGLKIIEMGNKDFGNTKYVEYFKIINDKKKSIDIFIQFDDKFISPNLKELLKILDVKLESNLINATPVEERSSLRYFVAIQKWVKDD